MPASPLSGVQEKWGPPIATLLIGAGTAVILDALTIDVSRTEEEELSTGRTNPGCRPLLRDAVANQVKVRLLRGRFWCHTFGAQESLHKPALRATAALSLAREGQNSSRRDEGSASLPNSQLHPATGPPKHTLSRNSRRSKSSNGARLSVGNDHRGCGTTSRGGRRGISIR